MNKIRWSHKGWYWFCPILWSDDQETAAPLYWSLYPLFKLSCWFDQARIFLTSMLVKDYEPTFMFKLKPIAATRTAFAESAEDNLQP